MVANRNLSLISKSVFLFVTFAIHLYAIDSIVFTLNLIVIDILGYMSLLVIIPLFVLSFSIAWGELLFFFIFENSSPSS